MVTKSKKQNKKKDPVLVVVQLSGGNDFLNTVIPFTNGIYYDVRSYVGHKEEEVLPFTNDLAFHPNAESFRELYKQGKMAIIQGIGYENSIRSHFRAMDIWHTCEPNTVATEGWLAKVIRELDPNSVNPLTAISFGKGLPRALAAPGVIATSVDNLDNYGLMTSIEDDVQRMANLDVFSRMYTPKDEWMGDRHESGVVMNYLANTGSGVLTGADMLKDVPRKYKSSVEYADNSIAKALRDVVRVHTANLGTRIFYTQHGGYDHHAQEMPAHDRLMGELSQGITDFLTDLEEHNASDEIVMLVFTEFGRRMRDNGSGTDHGSGGGAFIIGNRVKGGLYSEYPSIEPSEWLNGEDLKHTFDYRGVYGTLLEQHMGLDPTEIVLGNYEQLNPFK